ncbi:MAG: hypothetical protein WD995_09830 [Gemmatimonadota bacterium]
MIRARGSVRRLAVSTLLGAAAFVPASADAQSPGQLTSRCVERGGDLDRCTDVAVAARALTGQTSLLAGWGSDVPGSASTLGRKIGNRPRFSSSFRAGVVSVGLPDVFDQGTGRATDVSFVVPSMQLGLTAGLLDGFSPMPTVGGMLSLDVFGSVGITMPPSSEGFRGNSTAVAIGARVGVLRESFTLPGVSASVSHRLLGAVRLGDTGLGDPARIEVDPGVTSIRATIGKDLFGVGVLAGVGWDHASAETMLEVQDTGADVVRVEGPLDARRTIYFGGASFNLLLLQLSVEGGWAGGYPGVPGDLGSTFDPETGSPFGSLALRFTP